MSRTISSVSEERRQELADEYEGAISDCYDGEEFMSSALLLLQVVRTRDEGLLVCGWALADAGAFGLSESELLFVLGAEGSLV